MRTATLPCLLVLSACQSTPSPERAFFRQLDQRAVTALADASYARDHEVEIPQVLALDPIVAQLLRASFTAYDHQRRVLLENITNVDTMGYKRRAVRTVVQTITASDGQTFQVPVVQGTEAIFTTGVLELTQRNLDVAIDGEGFFAVMLLDGSTGYTRAGSLQIDANGKLVPNQGRYLLPEITLPSDTLEISIDPEGRVSGRTAGSPDTTTSFGQLTIHRFVNPTGMRWENGIYRPSDASGSPMTGSPGSNGLGLLKQGFLERSNVQLTSELVDLQILEKQHDTLVRTMQQFGMVGL